MLALVRCNATDVTTPTVRLSGLSQGGRPEGGGLRGTMCSPPPAGLPTDSRRYGARPGYSAGFQARALFVESCYDARRACDAYRRAYPQMRIAPFLRSANGYELHRQRYLL